MNLRTTGGKRKVDKLLRCATGQNWGGGRRRARDDGLWSSLRSSEFERGEK